MFLRFLAEVDDGPEDNYWIVDRLLAIYNAKKNRMEKAGEGDLREPHYEDQWWIGAKSYVSNLM